MKLLTPDDCSQVLSVSRSTVLRLIQDGSLPAVCLKRGPRKAVYRVREEVLTKWILAREKKVKKLSTAFDNLPSAPIADAPAAADYKPANGKAPDS